MLTVDQISELLLRHLQGALSSQEQVELDVWVGQSPARRTFVDSLNDEDRLREQLLSFRPEVEVARETEILQQINKRRRHRVHFLRTVWIRYAAAVVILIGISAYLWNTTRTRENKLLVQDTPLVSSTYDIAPGSNKAMLTLSDGRKVILDSAAGSTITDGILSIKNKNGQIIYNNPESEKKEGAVAMNTMTTPKGGQYKLVLPDGSQVWLNSASSLTYPVAFTGKTREIELSGEAYFDIKENKSKQFVVKTKEINVTVLGTGFNINAYTDEPILATTLVHGSVKVSSHSGDIVLQPEQQAAFKYSDKKIKINIPDIEQVLAWKNGLFNFHKMPLATALKQIARWYDVDIQYEGEIPKLLIYGEIGRDLNLSQVLEILSDMNVKYRLEDRKLIILSK